MKQVSGRELAQIIQRRGWTLAWVHGSRHIFTMAGRWERIVIPMHGKSAVKKGIASLGHEHCRAARGQSLEQRRHATGITDPHLQLASPNDFYVVLFESRIGG